MRMGKSSQKVILLRRLREYALPIRTELLHDGVFAICQPVERGGYVGGLEVADVQERVTLIEILHDPIHLRVKRNCNRRGLGHKSKNSAVKTARYKIVAVAQHAGEVSPALYFGNVNLFYLSLIHI